MRPIIAASLASSVVVLLTLGVPAAAADATGVWLRDTGASKVRIAPCGAALCGTLVWLRDGTDPNAKVGQRIFFDMKASGENAWNGSAFNPEDGKTYVGKMTVAGDRLTTSGCVLGGLICKSVSWSRSN